MATTAAILETIVRANTSAATRDLRQYDSYLRRVDKSSVSTTARTNTLGKATGALGSRMRSAAGYAAGAAAAYVSISQAKAAVTTTQDLAKTTAGLNRNLGLTVKEGSRWAAVAKSRDIDAKALTMSFTTLSRRVVDTSAALKEGGSAAQTAMAPFKRLGISQQEVVRGSKDLDAFLPRLADAFGNAAGGAERQASAQQLLGRGYATILPLFAQGAEGLKEQQMWADKYGTTLNEKTLKAQMDLVQAQRESKVAWVGIQMTFARFVTPALQEANKQFQEIAAIMADDKLTDTQKWQRVGKIVSGWADAAFNAFTTVLPKMVAAAGQRAPEIAKALVEGFANADVWGKAALAGVLIWKMLGGVGAVTSAAAAAGATLGTRVAIGFKAALARTGIGLAIVGLFEAATTKGGIIDTIQGEGNLIGKGFVDGIEAGIGGQLEKAVNRKSIPLLQKHVDHVNALIKVYEDAGDEVPADLRKLANAGERELAKLDASIADTKDSIHRLRVGFHQSLPEIMKEVDHNMDLISRSMDVNSKQGRAAIERNFNAAVKAIERAMEQGLIAEQKGYVAIADLMRDKLAAYGIKGAQAEKIIKAQAEGNNPQGGHPGTGYQIGGVIVPGYGAGDKVPAMLEPGEVVLNRKAVAAMGGADRANSINQAIPRFAKGGKVNFASGLVQALGPYSVPPIQFDPNHDAPNSHLHLSGDSVTWAKSLAAAIAPLGWSASESPWAGGVTVSHQDPGHYSGSAFDANSANESRSAVAEVARILGGSGAAVAGAGGGGVPSNARIDLPRWEGLTRVGVHAAAALNVVAAASEQMANKALRARMAVDDGNQGSASGGGSSSGGFLQLPATVNVTHQTSGLPGYPAEDIFASPGTRVGAPVAGKIARLSGQAGGPGGGGAYGYSIYENGGGRSYFMTHFGRVDVNAGQRVARGDVLGTVADYPGSVADHIHEGVSGMLRGGIIQKFATGGVPDALQKYDKVYPSAVYPSSAWTNLTQLPDNAIAAMAEWAGDKIGKNVPGVTMMKVQKGKGANRPGSRSSDNGYGLWAITQPYGAGMVEAFGGYAGMNNPISNAQVMAKMYPPGWTGGSPWYGTGFVHGDWNSHYTGKLLESGGGGGGGANGEAEEEEEESRYELLTEADLPKSIAKTRNMIHHWRLREGRAKKRVDRQVCKQNVALLSKHLLKLLAAQHRKRFNKKAMKIASMGRWPELLTERANAVIYAEDVLSGLETMGDFATDPIGSMGKGLQDILDAQMLHRSAIVRAGGVEQERRVGFSELLRAELAKPPKDRDRHKIRTWKAALGELDTFRGEYLTDDLTSLQGLVGIQTLFPPPWDAVNSPPYGALRGTILGTQTQMRELNAPVPDENQARLIELLEQQVREANLRTAVSQAQYDVFRNFAGGFAAGGFIPSGQWGVVGESGPEVVGGPMAVSPMGGTTVIINGDIVNTPAGKQPVEVRGAKAVIEQGTRGYGRRPLGSARGY